MTLAACSLHEYSTIVYFYHTAVLLDYFYTALKHVHAINVLFLAPGLSRCALRSLAAHHGFVRYQKAALSDAGEMKLHVL